MFKITHTKLLFNFLLFFTLCLGFYACEQNESFNSLEEKTHTSIFQQHLADNTQNITALDLGDGRYEIIGKQGTRINIDDALISSDGSRIRGEVEVVLIEIYSVEDMILNRKQTLADYNGQNKILESGGEIFVKIYQDGKELNADGNGDINIYLPTSNTGGAKEGMELFYGDEVGDQVIWKPTGKKVKVIQPESREGEEYLVILQNILGWINVDIIFEPWGGEEVECLEVKIECEQICEGMPLSTIVAIHINQLNSAFELNYDAASDSYILCGEGAPLTIGGLTVSFIVIIECEDGSLYSAIITTTVSPGYHLEIIDCKNFKQTDLGQLEEELSLLL